MDSSDRPGGTERRRDFPPASIRSRLVAGGLDLVVIFLATLAVPQPFPPLVVIGIFVVYHGTLTWWLQRTVGKALLGLRVARPNKQTSFWWSYARSGPGYLILGFGGLGLASAPFDPANRAVYDIALGGVVLQETDASLRPRGAFDRLVDYAKEHQRVAGDRKRTIGFIAAFWAWLSAIGSWLRSILDRLRVSSLPAHPSVLAEVSSTVAATAATAATAVGILVISVVPQAESMGRWLVADQQWFGDPSIEPAASPAGQWSLSHGDWYRSPEPLEIAKLQDNQYEFTAAFDTIPTGECTTRTELRKVTLTRIDDTYIGVSPGQLRVLPPPAVGQTKAEQCEEIKEEIENGERRQVPVEYAFSVEDNGSVLRACPIAIIDSNGARSPVSGTIYSECAEFRRL